MFPLVRHLGRLVVIVHTLARHDALFWLEDLPDARAASWLARRLARRKDGGLRPGQRLAAALEALGPSFVKLGQTLSTRTDLFGEQIAADLARLQDDLPPFDGDIAAAIVAEELDRPIEALFAHFDREAAAAASIAQVHFAETTEGASVAVKVLRPGIERAFARDLALMAWLARLAERHAPSLRRLKLVEVVRIFERTVHAEMDLRLEAAAASELAGNFAHDPTFVVPAIDWARTGERVLTIERVHGIRVDNVAALRAAGHEPRTVLAQAANSFFRQVFVDGFFHADMHPGNVFVREDGALVVIDFGIMGRLDRLTREWLADMLVGFLTGDYELVADVHFRAGYVPSHHDRAAFAQAARAIGEPVLERPLEEISLGRLLAQLFRTTAEFDMEVQPQLLLLQKTMLMAEGMGRRLDPHVNMWTLARPLIEEWMIENRGPEARLRRGFAHVGRRLERLPALLDDLEVLAARAAREPRDNETSRREGTMARLWPLWLVAAFAGWLLWLLD